MTRLQSNPHINSKLEPLRDAGPSSPEALRVTPDLGTIGIKHGLVSASVGEPSSDELAADGEAIWDQGSNDAHEAAETNAVGTSMPREQARAADGGAMTSSEGGGRTETHHRAAAFIAPKRPVAGTVDGDPHDTARFLRDDPYTLAAAAGIAHDELQLGKPSKTEWFRSHPDHKMAAYILTLKERADEKWLVAADLANRRPFVEAVSIHEIRLVTTNDRSFLWLVPRNDDLPNMRKLKAIAELSEVMWLRLTWSNMIPTGHEIRIPKAGETPEKIIQEAIKQKNQEPRFPAIENFGEVVLKAFGGRIIDRMDHPVAYFLLYNVWPA